MNHNALSKNPLCLSLVLSLSIFACGTKPNALRSQDQSTKGSALPEESADVLPSSVEPMKIPQLPSTAQPIPSSPSNPIPNSGPTPTPAPAPMPMPTGPTPDTKAYNPCPKEADKVCTIMPFGESTTNGNGSTHKGGYRVPLMKKLWEAKQNFTLVGPISSGPEKIEDRPFPRTHAGFSGHTIENSSRTGISEKAIDLMKTYKPHVVLLAIGGNDVDIKFKLDEAPDRMARLIDKILNANPDTLLLVAKVVPATNDDFNDRARVFFKGLEAVVKERTDKGKHLVLVDIFTPMVSTADFKNKLYFDRLHPNDAGYAVEADIWFDALKVHFR